VRSSLQGLQACSSPQTDKGNPLRALEDRPKSRLTS
jgi:hypothetical protein